MPKEFSDILDQNLESLLSGNQDLDHCCPEGDDSELKQLLELAMQSRQALAPEITAETKAAVKARVFSQIEAGRRSGQRTRRFWLRPVALAATLATLFGGTSLAAAAAGPDNLFYPLKQHMEDARTVLASQKLDRAEMEVAHAEKRLDELLNMAGQKRYEYVPAILANYDTHINNAIQLCKEAVAEGEDPARIEGLVTTSLARREGIVSALAVGMEMDEDEDGGEDGHDTWSGAGSQVGMPSAGSAPTSGSAGSNAGSVDREDDSSSGNGSDNEENRQNDVNRNTGGSGNTGYRQPEQPEQPDNDHGSQQTQQPPSESDRDGESNNDDGESHDDNHDSRESGHNSNDH